ncbi:thioredoxin domain-containing protein [Terrihabitans sp. B22-R8]|uniref:thioredoxin domain-containing protein n=1 Tax=Terrihabitans sp. B22-R8 TaxID=3425128 RepID=UPI00403C5603
MPAHRLRAETSPYLRQHADNPVDWWPWGPEALAEAQRTGRPILLSVGYAACHWCHVMAHESFEDQATAEVMNELYVNIKVDREERPDVDQVYMAALHAMGQQGGWPLTMFLTSSGEPFWGGTYFPKTSAYGRPGFVDALRGVAATYRERSADVAHNAELIRSRIAKEDGGASVDLSRADLDSVAQQLAGAIDPVHGGLKGAPKFPSPSLLEFLWRAGERTGDDRFTDLAVHTLDRICQGGIYDHIGGGFARYSVDAEWLVPHFEKMLYDNAQLIELLVLAWRKTGRDLFRRRIEETIIWLEREMLQSGGAFASSLDADSEGHEGRFYVWRKEEIEKVLGSDDSARFTGAYDITDIGNWEGVSIPNRSAVRYEDREDEQLSALRLRLLEARERRVRPGLDDKVLADWNGLTISALARAGHALDRPDWITRAETAFSFVAESMSRNNRLGHSWRDGQLVFPGFATDLAAMARAGLALAETTRKPAYLRQSIEWLDRLHGHHARSKGGYFLSADDGEMLLIRPAANQDEATPSASGVAAAALIRAAILTGEDRHGERADTILQSLGATAAKNVFGHLSVLNALDQRIAGLEILIVGQEADELRREAEKLSFTTAIVRWIEDVTSVPESHPAYSLAQTGGQARAIICAGQVCSRPITDATQLVPLAWRMRQGQDLPSA